ncbi:MAG: nuclease-related domain-containing protein [Microbacteriaceae bacterium]
MGRVFGTPGGSLNTSATWAANADVAEIGQAGERATASVLDRWAAAHDGAVFHDLTIPGSPANIDHAVLGARELLLIDTKMWRAGRYWTLFGTTRRGAERFAPADKRTLPMAVDRLRGYLRKAGSQSAVRPVSLLVVHPSKAAELPRLKLGLFRPQQAKAVRAPALERALLRHAPRGIADARTLDALVPLVK